MDCVQVGLERRQVGQDNERVVTRGHLPQMAYKCRRSEAVFIPGLTDGTQRIPPAKEAMTLATALQASELTAGHTNAERLRGADNAVVRKVPQVHGANAGGLRVPPVMTLWTKAGQQTSRRFGHGIACAKRRAVSSVTALA